MLTLVVATFCRGENTFIPGSLCQVLQPLDSKGPLTHTPCSPFSPDRLSPPTACCLGRHAEGGMIHPEVQVNHKQQGR